MGYLEKLGFRKNNAEKKIFDAKKNGLLIPGETRKGKQKQYYLSNYKYIIEEGAKGRKEKHKEIFPDLRTLLFSYFIFFQIENTYIITYT
jgi:hypothetical protein